MHYSREYTLLWKRVTQALASGEFRRHAADFDRRPLIRIANSLGGPAMRLLHWQRIVQLERIPHSDESEAVDAVAGIDLFGAPEVEVILVSHRWLRPSRDRTRAHPDSVGNEKAKALNHFSSWRRKWVFEKHGFLPEIYYWIDYSCIDQSQIGGRKGVRTLLKRGRRSIATSGSECECRLPVVK